MISKNRDYILYCESQAKQLFKILKKLKFENYNPETVEFFLKENKIKYKNYLIILDDLYSKCEFLMMRYSEDKDISNAYMELNGDAQCIWYFNLAYNSFIKRQKSILEDAVDELIEKIYKVPVNMARCTNVF